MTDEELVTSFLQGERDAFEVLLSRYQRPLYYMVKAMVMDSEEAKDITQEAFVRAFNHLSGLKKKDRFRAWLFQIGANLARDFFRKRREGMPMEVLDCSESDDKPEEKIVRNDLSKKVKDAIGSLPPRQQEVLTLRILNDMSFKEISETLSIQQETVRTNFHFAIKGLRDILSKKGICHGM
jgi:RNA polymerase sigma-70 factor (ECF subfamily)